MHTDRRDLAAGLAFIAASLAFGIGSLNLPLGTPLRMGTGFFPLALSILLGIIGLAVVVRSFTSSGGAIGEFSLRGMLLLVLAPVVFGLTIRGLGLAAATAITVAMASLSSRMVTSRMTILLTIGLTLFCVIVFHFLLGLPIPLIGSWLIGLI
jgi:hypothetical protein